MEDFNNFKPLRVFKFNMDGQSYFNVEINVGAEGLQKAEDLFEEHDNYPNGPGWEGLVTYIIEKESPDLIARIEFDSEGESCRAICQNEQDMVKLATLVQAVILDESRLSGYLAALPDEYKDA